MRYILFKSDGQFKHSGKYYLQGGRWHKLAENKPAPKGAPVSAHPKAAGHFEPKQHLSDEQWKQLELGSENSNAESHNKKLAQIKQLSDAGDVTGLLGLQVGSNTYGKIQGKLINQLLEAHGSPHKVVPGQKAGEHVAVQNVPAEEAPAQDEAPKTTGTQPIHKVSNPDAGLEAYVTEANGQNQGKFGVSLKDTDSGEFVSTIHFYKTKEEAIEAATKAAGLKVDKAAEESPKSTMADDGPKEGDTKDGLVFHNGRWHKQPETNVSKEQDKIDTSSPSVDGGDTSLKLPEFHESKNVAGVADYYNKVGAEIIKMAESGDIDGLQNLKAKGMQPNKKGKVGNTWAGKTDNSKILLKLHDEALKVAGKNAAISHLEQDKKQSDIPASEKTEDKKTVEKLRASSPDKAISQASQHIKEDISQDNVSAAEHADDKALAGKLDAASGYTVSVEAATTNAWKTTLSANAFKGDNPIWFSQNNASHIAFSGKVKFQNQEPTDHAKQVLAEFNAAKAAGYEFKHFKATKFQSAYAFVKDGEILTKKGMEALVAGNAPQAAEPEKAKQPRMVIPKVLPKESEPASAKLDQIPWDSLKLPADNKNAKTHNGKIKQIKKMAYAGDVEGLKAFKAGVNTYGKKQNKLAQTALAALEESQPVVQDTASSTNNPLFGKFLEKMIASEQYTKIEDISKKMITDDPGKKQTVIDALHNAGLHGLAKMVDKETSGKTPKQNAHDFLFEIEGKLASQGLVGQNLVANMAEYAKDWLQENPGKESDLNEALNEFGYPMIKFANGKYETGPKEGDTKQGADGMLVFKNGSWHKMEDEKPSIQVNKLTSADATALGKGIKTATGKKPMLKKMAVSGDIDGLINFINDPGNSSYAGSKLLAKKMISAMTGLGMSEIPTSPIGVAATQATKAPKAKATAPTSAQTSPTIDSMDAWKQVGGQQGSNDGGKFVDDSGQEWYCKFPKDEDHAKAEILAAKLYAAMGISSQDAKLISKNGKVGIASKWTNISKAGSPSELASVKGVLSGFAADAWLGNWDAVGLEFDNMQIDANGEAHRVDAGGSLMYRAQGAKKAFGNVVSEVDSLRDPNINPQSASVFGGMSKADITASVAKVLSLSDATIFDLVMEFGPGDVQAKADLIDTLLARKADLAEKFPKAKKKEKRKPDPQNLKVSADQLAEPHDFSNWNSSGKGLSSKAHVNEFNQKAEKDLLDFALKGNLLALQDYHFDAVNKETGESLGKKPINEHPSKWVKEYWSDLVSTLSYIAYPPEALKRFSTVVATSVQKVSDAFKSHKYGMTTNKADANSRLAFWIAIGSTKPATNLLLPGASTEFQSNPVGVPKITDAMKQQAQSAYSALGSGRLVKRFINGIQSSGSYNDNFRDGLLKTKDGYDAVAMVKDAYDFAEDKPEGFEIYKWVSFPKDMEQQLLSAPNGTVFQNPGSMCCSYDPTGTSGFGKDRMRIRYAKGAKAVDTFGSGAFHGEKEITTLPGQRFVILSCKKVMCPIKGHERTELDVLMLPPDPSYVAELEVMKA